MGDGVSARADRDAAATARRAGGTARRSRFETPGRATGRSAAGLERRIEERLAALLPEYPRAALCVAFSGGLDSTVLLAALAAVRSRGSRSRAGRRGAGRGLRGARGVSGWPHLRAVHVDHGLHQSSGAWARHCRAVADRLGVPITVMRIAVKRPRGASLEAAAREARYGALAGELADGEVLLTAHHADDQLETVLLQLLRGAGLRGIAAMPAAAPFGRGRIARPLLEIERSQIEAWARARGLEWIEDATNADERLDRNYLRRRIVPLLRARWPAASRAASRAARHAAEAQQLLDARARADVERAAVGEALAIPRLRALAPDRRRNALRYWIVQQGHPLPDTRRLGELAGALIEARADARPEVRWGHSLARRERNRLTLHGDVTQVSFSRRAPSLSVEWSPRSAPLELPAGLGRLELAADPHGPVDLDAVPDRVTVRLRRGGERLRLAHGAPRRLLKALLQEAEIPQAERARIPLLWSGEQLLAVGDLWVDAAVRADASKRRRGRLIWHRGSSF